VPKRREEEEPIKGTCEVEEAKVVVRERE
jgi:hypothetical protein